MGKLIKRIAIAGILVGIAWLFASVGSFSLDKCNSIQNRAGELEVVFRRN